MKHLIKNGIAHVIFFLVMATLGTVFLGCATVMATDAPAKEQTVIDIGPRLAKIEADMKPALEALKATPEWKERVKAVTALQAVEKKVSATKAWQRYNALKTEKAYLIGMKKGGKQ